MASKAEKPENFWQRIAGILPVAVDNIGVMDY
jgi:hypothetical protein